MIYLRTSYTALNSHLPSIGDVNSALLPLSSVLELIHMRLIPMLPCQKLEFERDALLHCLVRSPSRPFQEASNRQLIHSSLLSHGQRMPPDVLRLR